MTLDYNQICHVLFHPAIFELHCHSRAVVYNSVATITHNFSTFTTKWHEIFSTIFHATNHLQENSNIQIKATCHCIAFNKIQIEYDLYNMVPFNFN